MKTTSVHFFWETYIIIYLPHWAQSYCCVSPLLSSDEQLNKIKLLCVYICTAVSCVKETCYFYIPQSRCLDRWTETCTIPRIMFQCSVHFYAPWQCGAKRLVIYNRLHEWSNSAHLERIFVKLYSRMGVIKIRRENTCLIETELKHQALYRNT